MREAGMSVLTTGKPSRLTRAAAPARQQAGVVSPRRQGRPGPGAVRHLRVVPDTGLPDRTQTARANGRLQGGPAVRGAGPVSVPGPPRPGAVYQNLTSVVVHPGQTLWSIASQAEPTADPRIVMQQIIDLNALYGTSVVPGQRLWVPRG